ncbi:VOC family protein [Chloroflexota bacterium]
MKVSGVDHLHVFQPDLEVAANFLSDVLGIRWLSVIERDWVHIRVTFCDAGMEIIQPTGGDKIGIEEHLNKHGPGIGSVGVFVNDIEACISDLESKGVVLKSRGSYPTRPEIDIRASIFTPESAHGVPIEIVEYGDIAPMATASLDWVSEMSWMQPEVKPDAALKVGRLHHLNLFQDNLEISTKFFSKIFGLKWVGPIEVPELKLRVAYSDAAINIIQPMGQDNYGVADYMKKHGEGVGSLGFKVPDIEAAIKVLQSKGVRLLSKGVYGTRKTDLKSAVFDPDTAYGLMIELVEYQDTAPVALANLDWVKRLPWMEKLPWTV